MSHIQITDSFNLGYFKNNIYGNYSQIFPNANGIGFSSKTFSRSIEVDFRFSDFIVKHWLTATYDGIIKYKNSVFDDFDLFVMFHNKLNNF